MDGTGASTGALTVSSRCSVVRPLRGTGLEETLATATKATARVATRMMQKEEEREGRTEAADEGSARLRAKWRAEDLLR